MTSAAMFSSFRSPRPPSPESFLAPAALTGVALLHTVAAVSADVVASYSGKSLPFQRRNSRSLVRKVEVFAVMLELLRDSGPRSLPPTATLCFRELYLILYRSKILLDYCAQSSRTWLVLQNMSVSGLFHDRSQEISALLDVLPLEELGLGGEGASGEDDVREQVELLRAQSGRAKLLAVDERAEALRLWLFRCLGELEGGKVPDRAELESLFVDGLGIRDAKRCRAEIEFLEEAICNDEGELEPTASVINGLVALARYCRFLLFGFDDQDEDGHLFHSSNNNSNEDTNNNNNISSSIADAGWVMPAIPKDFCCPISLELMRDPVIICTGQSYDRGCITRWMEEGHSTCPKTGQFLSHTRLVPNRSLRNLISQWCAAHGIPFDPLECAEPFAAAYPTKAAASANRATTALLVARLAAPGSPAGKAVAVREMRLLAKAGRENRGYIAEAGAIPHLKSIMVASSSDAAAQENSVTAMLNLSIHDRNKRRIMEEEGCLEAIVGVLRFGLAAEAKENAAATLFSLSSVHDHKKRIADEDGAVEALAELLKSGTPRGKKDAVTALFNLSTHPANCARLIEGGAVAALVASLATEGVAEEAAGTLGLVVRLPAGSAAVAEEEEAAAVAGLIRMMRSGTPRGKENAVAALLELCRSGGPEATERVVRAPALVGPLQQLLFKGTKRARRKAASLARFFYKWDKTAAFHFGGLGAGYALAGDSAAAANRDSSFGGDVSMPVAISVHVV